MNSFDPGPGSPRSTTSADTPAPASMPPSPDASAATPGPVTPEMIAPFAALFSEADFGFVLRLQRGDPRDYFAARAADGAVLAERRRWIREAPAHHLLALDDAGPAIAELGTLAAGWGVTPAAPAWEGEAATGASGAVLGALGGALEPDLVLLRRREGQLRVVAGCVCFPSSWSLPEKAGLTVSEIHGVVPGLNDALGPAVDRFLDRLAPGVAWLRANWGLSRTRELNQDPWRGLPRLEAGLDPAGVYLRAEHQALLRLPESDGVLFGIRVSHLALGDLVRDEVAGARLARALATMPEPMARYKGLDAIRPGLCRWLTDRTANA